MESFTGAAKNELKLGKSWNCWCQNLIRVVYQEGIEVLADTQIVAIAILILRYGCSGQIETLQGFHCTTHLQHYDLERKKNKSRHQDKKDFNDLDVLLTSPGPLWLMMSRGAFRHFFAYTLSIYLLNVCLKFLLFATDWHRQATARDAESFYAPGLIIISRYRPPLPEDTISLLLAMVRCHEEDMEGTRRWIKEVVR